MATQADLIERLRGMISDDDPTKNILNGKQQMYNDTKLLFFINRAIKDINKTHPTTNYTIATFPENDDELIVQGAVIQSLIAEGILQLRNQLDYNDAGLALSMFNKTGGYQGWAGFLLQTYMNDKMEFKRGVIPNSFGAGFYAIRSPGSPDWGCNY